MLIGSERADRVRRPALSRCRLANGDAGAPLQAEETGADQTDAEQDGHWESPRHWITPCCTKRGGHECGRGMRARVLGECTEKRRQSADCTERTDRRDDIDGVNDAAPIQTQGDADSRPHGFRATFAGASLSGCPMPPRAL